MRSITIIATTAFAALALMASAAFAAGGQQIAKLLANDGAAEDWFGRSVAISGGTAIAGARRDDDNGDASGSAYLFDATTGQQTAKLLPSDGAAGDVFGDSVAIAGTTAIVGAMGNDDNGSHSGSAYLFDTITGQQIAKLLPDDSAAEDIFGWSVGISGTIAIVSALYDDDNGQDSGSAYLFDTATGKQITKLLPNDPPPLWPGSFGYSVAISDSTAIVGAFRDVDNGLFSGAAYLFDTATGQQLFKLLPNDGAVGDNSGQSVAISGNTAIISAPFDDDACPGDPDCDSGSAYLFDAITGQQIAKLLPSDGAPDDLFGWSVGINGTIAIVGALIDDDNGDASGSAYLFDIRTGQEIAKLLPNDGAAEDWFGRTVGISGLPGKEVAIVGAVGDDDNGSNSGSAYLFDAGFQCPADLDGSGLVDVLDLLALLTAWGPCTPGGCDADLNGDASVDVLDLLELIGNWGPC